MRSCNTRLQMERISIRNLCLCMRMLIIILACLATSNALQSDINCLRSIKESLEDPENLLSSWDFNNQTEGFICRFAGVECWHPEESKVLHIVLSDMGLKGPFPMGIKSCTSITGLDLSSNHLSGPIPSNLPAIIPYITILDLSNNNLSGPIPPSIANFSFINVLKLDNNSLTGQIPTQLSKLYRLKEFSVANNGLSGPVPILGKCSVNYANNPGICGLHMKACKNNEGHYIYFSDHPFFPGFIAGFSTSVLFMFFYWPRVCTSNMGCYHLFLKTIKGKYHLITRSPQIVFTNEISTEETKVTAMEKHIRRLSLPELEIATNDFAYENVIGYGNMGLMYKAVFPNSLLLAVKRLHKFESYEKEFLSEIEILGRLRQTNLVPLLGFCFGMDKKFLVYQYMCNGTLHNWLHCRPQMEEGNKMGWSLRLKIAVGIARGLACLHHNNILRVAHRKLSSKCILLDDKFEPKISNFGDAMILVDASGMSSSGYKYVVLDSNPYKEDVYSFGILLLEFVTGTEPSTWIETTIDHMCGNREIDEHLMKQGFDEEIHETIRIAEKCIHPGADEATTMLQVYQAIRAIGVSKNEISVDSCMDVEMNEGDV